MLRHGGLNHGWDGEKGNEAVEKSLYGNFIGSIQYRRHCPTDPSCLKGQAQAWKTFYIRWIKMQRLHLEEIQGWESVGKPFRIRQGIGNRDTHVRNAELRQDRAIVKFDHRMDDTLWMHNDLHLLNRDVKQMMRLNNLEAFIHHGRRVNGNFTAHFPIRMLQRLFDTDMLHRLT